VTAGNTGDAQPTADLIKDLSEQPAGTTTAGDTAVYGDSAYGAGEVLAHLHAHDIDMKTKVQPPNAPAGKLALSPVV
jgi:hypothetical protein